MTIHLFYFYANRGQEISMKKWWFKSMWSKKELEHSCGLSKSTGSLGPIENTSRGEDPNLNLNDTEKNIQRWRNNDSSSYSNVNHLFPVMDDSNVLFRVMDGSPDDPILVRDSKGNSYSICFNIENEIFEMDKGLSFISKIQSAVSKIFDPNYPNTRPKNGDTYNDRSVHDTKSSWNNHINNCIDSYLDSQICIGSPIPSGIDSDSYILSYIFSDDSRNKSESFSLGTIWNGSNFIGSDEEESGSEEEESVREEEESGSDEEESGSEEEESVREEEESVREEEESVREEEESSNNLEGTQKYRHLWVQCENCYGLNYKKFFKSKMNICEQCGYHLKMSSSDRIELSIDQDTWNPMDEDMVSMDPIEFDMDPIEFDMDPIEFDMDPIEFDMDPFEFDSEEKRCQKDRIIFEMNRFQLELERVLRDHIERNRIEMDPIELDSEEERCYKDRIDFYQRETGLTEAVQTGIGQLNGIPVAIGVMDFQFMGGSMGSVVGEKITRLIEYASKNFLPLIIVCASGGARMQEGSLSLMQMAKISAALYDYQSNKKLFYVSILTSPTTGGVTASFGMLGDIIIAEPEAYIAFAGKRVIEQTLNTTVPEGSQEAENLFDKGLFDPIVPRNLLKVVLSELFQLHAFFPLKENQVED